MKKLFTRILCIALAVCSAMALTACGNQKEEGSSVTSTTAETTAAAEVTAAADTTAAPESVEQTTADPAAIKYETDLTQLHALTKPGDLFTGYWHITDGVGKKLTHFVFGFDGNKNAYLLMNSQRIKKRRF